MFSDSSCQFYIVHSLLEEKHNYVFLLFFSHFASFTWEDRGSLVHNYPEAQIIAWPNV